MEQPTNFWQFQSFDLLQHEADLPYWSSRLAVQYQPQTMAIESITLELLVEPGFGVSSIKPASIVPRDLTIPHHGGHEIEISGGQFA